MVYVALTNGATIETFIAPRSSRACRANFLSCHLASMGRTLTCEATATSYSRTTAWCWAPDGTELNCAMVEGRYAVPLARFDPMGGGCAVRGE